MEIDPQTLVGKTVKSIDNSATNAWLVTFTDGSRVWIDTERKAYGIYGPVLARWLSGEPTTTAPVPSDRILVPIGGGGSEPVPKGEDESKRGSGRSARKAARARPKGEDAAPASTAAIPPHLLAAVDEPAPELLRQLEVEARDDRFPILPALLRDLEQAFRLWPAPAVVQELAALYLPSEKGQ